MGNAKDAVKDTVNESVKNWVNNSVQDTVKESLQGVESNRKTSCEKGLLSGFLFNGNVAFQTDERTPRTSCGPPDQPTNLCEQVA